MYVTTKIEFPHLVISPFILAKRDIEAVEDFAFFPSSVPYLCMLVLNRFAPEDSSNDWNNPLFCHHLFHSVGSVVLNLG